MFCFLQRFIFGENLILYTWQGFQTSWQWNYPWNRVLVPPMCQKYEQINEMVSSVLRYFSGGGGGGYREKFDQFSVSFSKTDVSQWRNVAKSAGTFHSIEKCLLYNEIWLRQLVNWFMDLQEPGRYHWRNPLMTIAYFIISWSSKRFWNFQTLNVPLVDIFSYMYHARDRRKIDCLEIENYFHNEIGFFKIIDRRSHISLNERSENQVFLPIGSSWSSLQKVFLEFLSYMLHWFFTTVLPMSTGVDSRE